MGETDHKDNLLFQLVRYAFVGGAAFIADAGSLWLIYDKLNIHYLIAAVAAFIIGLAVNYILSKLFVFRQKKKNKIAEFLVYCIIGVIGLGLTELLLYLFTELAGFHVLISKAVSALIVLIWNFAARKVILYRR